MKKDEMLMKEALKLIGEKVAVTKLTFTDWCNRGLLKFRTEKHGRFKYRVFKKAEIERLKRLLPTEKDRIIGKPLLPK